MAEAEVKDIKNNSVDKINLRDDIFGVPAKPGVLHEAVINFLANQRQGTHATKTRGLISGRGKKPWRQKQTGRARAGSIRSPLWRGGGTVFGPQPRDYSYKLPKKVKRLALNAALHEKLSGGEIVFIDNLSLKEPKTKDMVSISKSLGLYNKSVLIVLPEKNDAILLSVRNVTGIYVKRVTDINTYDVLSYNIILMTKEAVAKLEEIKES